MIKVSLIGSGNIAQHLLRAFAKTTDIEIVQVMARTNTELLPFILEEKIVSNYDAMLPTDVVIIAVSDNAIAKVSSQITLKNALVVHTSGTIAMEALDRLHTTGETHHRIMVLEVMGRYARMDCFRVSYSRRSRYCFNPRNTI